MSRTGTSRWLSGNGLEELAVESKRLGEITGKCQAFVSGESVFQPPFRRIDDITNRGGSAQAQDSESLRLLSSYLVLGPERAILSLWVASLEYHSCENSLNLRAGAKKTEGLGG